MIKFKNPKYTVPIGKEYQGLSIQAMFAQLDPRMKMILMFMDAVATMISGEDTVITRIYEPEGIGKTHPTDVPPWHFVDVRIYKGLNNERLRTAINALFPYCDGYESCPDLRHGTAPHYHLQVLRKSQPLAKWLSA